MSATGLILLGAAAWALLSGKKKNEEAKGMGLVIEPIEPPAPAPVKPPSGGAKPVEKACVYSVIAANGTKTFPATYKDAKDLAVQDAVMVNAAIAGGIVGSYKAPWILTRECGGALVELHRVNKGEGSSTAEGMIAPASGGWQGGTTIVIPEEE